LAAARAAFGGCSSAPASAPKAPPVPAKPAAISSPTVMPVVAPVATAGSMRASDAPATLSSAPQAAALIGLNGGLLVGLLLLLALAGGLYAVRIVRRRIG